MKPINKKRAFTLVEILIVVAIISVIFIVVVSKVDFATDNAKTSGTQADMRSYQMALKTVAIEQQELTDDIVELANLLNKNLDESLQVIVGDNGQLETMATDPWGNPYILEYAKPGNTAGQVIIKSKGQDGKDNTADDVASVVRCDLTSSGTNVVIENIAADGATDPSQPDAHTHSYDKQVMTSGFLNTAGNCVTKETYFYSCECGAKGSDTFDGVVELNTHTAEVNHEYVFSNENEHSDVTSCSACNTPLDTITESHVFENNKCEFCGYERHVHVYDKEVKADKYKNTDATCTSKLSFFYSCSCGEKGTLIFEVGEVLPHSYTTEIITNATCTSKGVKRRSCTNCSYSEDSEINMSSHTYTNSVKGQYKISDATCIAKAKYYNSCSVCGLKGTGVFAIGEVNIDNHVGETEVSYNNLSSTQHTVETKCLSCNNVTNSNTEDHVFNNIKTCTLCNSHTHNYDQKTNTNLKSAATCTSKALYYYECVCGDVSPNTYEFGEEDVDNHAGNIVNGGEEDVHSKYDCCGLVVLATHSYTQSILEQATCTEKGTTKYTCSCGYSYTESIEMISHTYNQKIINDNTLVSAATCTEAATYNYSCVCGLEGTTMFGNGSIDANNHAGDIVFGGTLSSHEKYSCCNVIANNNHTYSSENTKSATCTSVGIVTYTCGCGYSYTEETSKNVSNHSGVQINGGTESVHTKYSCCGQTINSIHSFGNSVSVQATCISTGKMRYSCSCGYYYENDIAIDKTYYLDENNDLTCDLCNASLISPLKHNVPYSAPIDITGDGSKIGEQTLKLQSDGTYIMYINGLMFQTGSYTFKYLTITVEGTDYIISEDGATITGEGISLTENPSFVEKHLFFEKKYICTDGDTVTTMIFHENYYMDLYTNDVLEMENSSYGLLILLLGNVQVANNGKSFTITTGDNIQQTYIMEQDYIKYNALYSAKTDILFEGNPIIIVSYGFIEDGSIKIYINGVNRSTLPSGTFSVSGTNILSNGEVVARISSDGVTLEDIDGKLLQLAMDNDSFIDSLFSTTKSFTYINDPSQFINTIQFGKQYVPNDLSISTEEFYTFTFYEDGTYTQNTYEYYELIDTYTSSINNMFIYGNLISINKGGNYESDTYSGLWGLPFYIFDADGLGCYDMNGIYYRVGEIPTFEIPIKWGEAYCYNNGESGFDYVELAAFFGEDGTLTIYRNGYHYYTCDSITYEGVTIFDDGSAFAAISEDGLTITWGSDVLTYTPNWIPPNPIVYEVKYTYTCDEFEYSYIFHTDGSGEEYKDNVLYTSREAGYFVFDGLKISYGNNNYLLAYIHPDGQSIQFPSSNIIATIDYSELICPHRETTLQNQKEKTCTSNGYTGDYVCNNCGIIITKGSVLTAPGHNIELKNYVAATCTGSGYSGNEVCTHCNQTVSAGKEIPSTGHTDVNIDYICDACNSSLTTLLFEKPYSGPCNHTYIFYADGSAKFYYADVYFGTLSAGTYVYNDSSILKNSDGSVDFTISESGTKLTHSDSVYTLNEQFVEKHIYHGLAYSCTQNDITSTFIFNVDMSMTIYENGVVTEEYSSGYTALLFGYSDVVVSEDGKSFTITNDDNVFTYLIDLDFKEVDGGFKCGEKYIVTYINDGLKQDDLGKNYIIFNEDGSSTSYVASSDKTTTQEAGYWIYYSDKLESKETESTVDLLGNVIKEEVRITNNGMTIEFWLINYTTNAEVLMLTYTREALF